MVLTNFFRKALAMGDKKIEKLTKKSKSPNVVFFQDGKLVMSIFQQDLFVYAQGSGNLVRCFKQIRLLTNPQGKIDKMGNLGLVPIENLEWKSNETIPFVFCPAGGLYVSDKNPLVLHSHIGKNTYIKDKYLNIRQPFYISQFPITCYLYDWVMAENRWDHQRLENSRTTERKYKNPYPITDEPYWKQIEFCNRLSKILGFDEMYKIKSKGTKSAPPYDREITTTITRNPNKKGIRLPTILEWVYAANANSDFKYAGSNNILEIGYSDGFKGDLLVGQKKPNAWGIHDMSGFLEYSVESTIDELISQSIDMGTLENVPTTNQKEIVKLLDSDDIESMKESVYTTVGSSQEKQQKQSIWTVNETESEYGCSAFDGFFVVLDVF